MGETWIPKFTRWDGPANKQGYWGISSRPLSLIEGDVKHSMEGSMSAAINGALLLPSRQASWTFSIPKAPLPGGSYGYQHYPLESVTWHCGVKGDLDSVTDLIGNVSLVGIEHEGVAGEVLTAHQQNATIYVSDYLRQHTFAAQNPPELAVNLWEHNWLWATACPSDRIRWAPIINELKRLEAERSDPDMSWDSDRKQVLDALEEIKKLAKNEADVYVRAEGHPEVYRLNEENQELIHAVNMEVFMAQTPDPSKVLPKDHSVFKLRTVFPAGVPPELLK